MTNMSWRFWNAAACVVLCVGTAEARTLPATEQGAGPSPAVYGVGDEQTHDELLDGPEKLGANAKEKNEVNLDKNMMALTAGRGGRYGDLSTKMDLITVRSYEFASKEQYSQKELDVLRRKLDSNGWSHVVRNQDGDETNDIAVKTTGDGYMSDMVILNAEAKEVNIVHLRGHFRMEDVAGAMGSMMGITRGAGAGAMSVIGPLGAMGATSHSSSSNKSSSHSTSAPPPPPSSPPPSN